MSTSRRRFMSLCANALSTAMAVPLVGCVSPRSWLVPSCARNPDALLQPGTLYAVYVPAKDGARIALDVLRPADLATDHPLPTILVMTRYWRGEIGATLSRVQKFYAARGFVVVVGDVRGTGASFGVWAHPRSRAETGDFTAIMDWIVAQPWSNGQVIGVGNSYEANTADWMAERNHPALKAIVPRFPDYDPYADLYFPGGVPNTYTGQVWGLRVKDMDQNRRVRADGTASPGVRPVDGPDGAHLLQEAIAQRDQQPSIWEGLQHVTFRDDRPPQWNGASMDDWSIQSHVREVEASAVPIQTWGGWMDAGTANGAIRRFLRQSNPQHAFIGPWSHGGFRTYDPLASSDAVIEPDFPTQQEEDLCFIHKCLGPAAPRRGENLLSYYTMGEGRWKTTDRWPPVGVRSQRFYLAATGALLPHADRVAGVDTYDVDFTLSTGRHNRWATNNDAGYVSYGDRAALAPRMLTYTSAALEQDLEITGHPVVTLYVQSTHDDGNFFAYLECVTPNGTVHYLTEGQLRALHRKISPEPSPRAGIEPFHSFLRRDALPLRPGEIARLSFALHPISALIRRGQRLRVAICGADADTFQRLPISGNPRVTVHRSGLHASCIELPTIVRR